MKHAYLIIAHNEFYVLSRLIECLDDERNAIYIHFDKKTKKCPTLTCKKATITYVSDDSRISVYWGDISQLKAEFSLLELAQKNGPYQYYHIISGVHLPLKTQNQIHNFFCNRQGKEVLHYTKTTDHEITMKLRRFHFLLDNAKLKKIYLIRFAQFIWSNILRLQKIFKIYTNKDQTYRKADQWVSLTEKAVVHLIKNKNEILKEYKYAYCSDEFFVASELSRHPEQFTIINSDRLLKVHFQGISPICFKESDYDDLIFSDYLFARKFSISHKGVVDRITNYLLNEAEHENGSNCNCISPGN